VPIKKDDNQKTFDTIYGPFTLNRPSLHRQLEVHKSAARSLGGVQNLDAMGELYALWMATVNVCAMSPEQLRLGQDKAPKGWPEGFTWETAYDPEFLPDLVKRFNEWQASFRKSEDIDSDKEGVATGSQESGVRTSDALAPAAD
jgi:hypothetical protein